MADPGRARGRSRGRGRGSSDQRPGQAAPPTRQPQPDPAPGGRGRSRGEPGASEAPGSQAQAPVAEVQVAPPTAQMAAMTTKSAAGEDGNGKTGERRQRRGFSTGDQVTTTERKGSDKEGSAGKPVKLVTNCFKMIAGENHILCQYQVSFSPEINSRRLRMGLIRAESEILGNTMAFDGMTLFLPKKLPDPVTSISATTRTNEANTITITLIKELAPTSPDSIQMYNVIFRKVLKLLGMQKIGRDDFHPNGQIDIPQHQMQIWPGFRTSILEYDSDILLMANIFHKILRMDTVLSILYSLSRSNDGDTSRFHADALRKLVGQIVLTRYNNKTYRVDDIDWDARPTNTFARKDGSQMSYIQYYEDVYDRKVSDDKQPLLVHRPKKKELRPGMPEKIHLIPELCLLTGLSDELRSNFQVMKDIAQHTRISPQDLVDSLNQFIQSIPDNAEAQAHLDKWKVSFSRNLLELDGRILPPEFIYQKNKKINYDPLTGDWSRETRGYELSSAVSLDNWILIFTSRDQGTAMDFSKTLVRVSGPMGMQVADPSMQKLNDDRAETYVKCIRENVTTGTTQMVVCILPNNRKDRYDAIKKQCCLESPVPSQCIVSRTLSKKQTLMSVCTNIAKQINCKMGGELWNVEIPIKECMVMGIDVYQDSSSKGLSVGGFVATLNDSLSRYYSRCTFQRTGQELIDGLKVCMQAAFKKYNEINGKLPNRVVIYRDGVGDGQMPAVVEHELPQILDTFKAFNAGWKPKCMVTIVKKRISNRFFLQGPQLSNPPPGTIVDSVVTNPACYDFFLISQSVRQGTATPTGYIMIHDTSGLKPDHIQRLTYKLTHLYYNWPGTICVPAPCLYAHKLAFLVGESLHKAPKVELADRLYFL